MYELELLPTTPTMQVERQRPLPMDRTRSCHRKLGKLRRLPTASRRGACARLGSPAAEVNAPRGGVTVCINDVIETAKRWLSQTSRKYKADPFLAGRPDAAYLVQTKVGRCFLGYLIAPIPSSPHGTCHLTRWSSRSIRRTAKSSLGGEIYVCRETDGAASGFL